LRAYDSTAIISRAQQAAHRSVLGRDGQLLASGRPANNPSLATDSYELPPAKEVETMDSAIILGSIIIAVSIVFAAMISVFGERREPPPVARSNP
jgi:hypothetical protein